MKLIDILKYIQALLVQIFPPHVAPVPAPPSPGPNPAPPPIDPVATLTNIIKAYNTPYVSYYPVGSTVINSEIDKIDEATAAKIAALIVKYAKSAGLDVAFAAACIMQESRFDPKCFSHNLGPTRPTATFEDTDWGLCQMNGSYLPSKPGMAGLTQDQMVAKAQDPTWSVPMFCSIMQGNIEIAKNALISNTALSSAVLKLNNTKLSYVEFLATLFYNRGVTGGTNYVLSGNTAMIQHPFHVATWYQDFAPSFEPKPNLVGKLSMHDDILPGGSYTK